ncbi:MAG: hypothetical protein R2867_22190 [Caldilineaceae bacterium]
MPEGIEGLYQIDIRAEDLLGNRNDEARGLWQQWRGLIDTRAPDAAIVTTYSGAGATAQSRHTVQVTDFSLTDEHFVSPCPLQPDDYQLNDAAYWTSVSFNTPRLQSIKQQCDEAGYQRTAPRIEACDAFGRCTAAAQERYMLYTIARPVGGTSDRIERTNLFGGNGREILFTSPTDILALGVDEVHGHIYWIERVDSTNGRIRRADLDGANPSDLPNPLLVKIPTTYYVKYNDLIVDAAGGKLFWTDQQQLKRANLDGSGVTTLFTLPDGAVDTITKLAFDRQRALIYFGAVDGHFIVPPGPVGAQIWSIRSDGSNPQLLISTLPENEPKLGDLVIAPDGQSLLWMQWPYLIDHSGRLFRLGVNSTGSATGAPTLVNGIENRFPLSFMAISPSGSYLYYSLLDNILQAELTTGAVGDFYADTRYETGVWGVAAYTRRGVVALVPGSTTTATIWRSLKPRPQALPSPTAWQPMK